MDRLILIGSLATVVLCLVVQRGEAQNLPTESNPPGQADRSGSILGPSPGAGSNELGSVPGEGGVLPTRPGRGGGVRIPSSATETPSGFAPTAPHGIIAPALIRRQEGATSLYGSFDVSSIGGIEDLGPENGLTLDRAIEIMLERNLELRTQYFEIPQAQADILTAGLRANPLLYADATAVPYGNYSEKRPGGQTQYDINITYPVDVTRKRKARELVACRAKRVLEAQYQDAVRLQIDNLYTAFIDVHAARDLVRYAEANAAGLQTLQHNIQDLLKAGERTEADLNLIRIRVYESDLGVREARMSLRRAKQTLGVLLNVPPMEVDNLEVRGSMRLLDILPPSDDKLISLAYETRPDLQAYRLGISRAEADVKLAHANRLADVYVLYGPYVFQNNAPFGTKSAHSWSAAITVPLPIYNRNQGNIERAKLNVSQTLTGMAALERLIVAEVFRADQEYDITRSAVTDYETKLLPAARQIRDNSLRRYLGGESSLLDYLEAQRSFNENARQYRDTLIRHRRSMLDLNTALGRRVLP